MVFPPNRQPRTELRRRIGVGAIGDVMMIRYSLRLHGHVERKDDADCTKACARMVEGTALVGRLNNTWQNTLSADMRLLKVDPRDIHDLEKWIAIGRRKANRV